MRCRKVISALSPHLFISLSLIPLLMDYGSEQSLARMEARALEAQRQADQVRARENSLMEREHALEEKKAELLAQMNTKQVRQRPFLCVQLCLFVAYSLPS